MTKGIKGRKILRKDKEIAKYVNESQESEGIHESRTRK